jgi:hypothetical protein
VIGARFGASAAGVFIATIVTLVVAGTRELVRTVQGLASLRRKV